MKMMNIADLLTKLDQPMDRLVLMMLYVNHYDVNEASEELSVSRSKLFRLKREALERLSKAI